MHAIHHTVAYLHSTEQSRSKFHGLFSVDSVVTDGATSQNFRHWSAEASSDRLLGSAKPGHIEPSDWSAAKKTEDGYQGKGWSCWILSGLTICARDRLCLLYFEWKLNKTHALLSNSMQFWGYWRIMQIRQRILNCTEMQNYAFHSRQSSETFDVLHAFLSSVVAKLFHLKNSPFFGPHVCNDP